MARTQHSVSSYRGKSSSKNFSCSIGNRCRGERNGYESIWSKNNERIGITTTGYGHNIDKSLAMAFVIPNFSEPRIEQKAHLVGKEKHCVVFSNKQWDPEGLRLRS